MEEAGEVEMKDVNDVKSSKSHAKEGADDAGTKMEMDSVV